MNLSLQNFSTLVETAAAAVQGAAQTVLDLTVGSVLRAVLEANASVALWIQWLIVEVLSATRLATSTGADCDSFGADFGFTRLAAIAATGEVTFSRFTPTIAAFIPNGSAVATPQNTQGFLVVPDATNAAYSATAGGYTLAAGTPDLAVAVCATTAGAAGNVQAGAISVLSSAISGVDTVTNATALTGGADAEQDAAFKARFGNFLAGLSRATDTAIGVAITDIQQGLSYQISENVDSSGAVFAGHFVVTVDDGSGHPPPVLLTVIEQAVDAIRPVGTSFSVRPPIIVTATVSLGLVTAVGSSHAAAVAAVAAALEGYIAGLGIGATLNYTKLSKLAYDASASVVNVTSLLLNGGVADLSPPVFGVVRPGTIAVD